MFPRNISVTYLQIIEINCIFSINFAWIFIRLCVIGDFMLSLRSFTGNFHKFDRLIGWH
jgi:hypothetical protein